jgi:hypothetical protein
MLSIHVWIAGKKLITIYKTMRKILINTSVFCLIAMYIQLVYALVCLHIDGDRKIYDWEKLVFLSTLVLYLISLFMSMVFFISYLWSGRR